jgi:hypothetical protein
MDLKDFLLDTARCFSSDEGNTHVCDVYVRTGLINVLCNVILLFHEFTCDYNRLFSP